MKLIFLYGPAACGKLTVARELAARTGWKLFHNHLTIDLLTSVFEFGHPGFVRLRETIWLGMFEEAARAGVSHLIFTYAPERTVTEAFLPAVERVMAEAGGEVVYIHLDCPRETVEARITDPSRRAFGKIADLNLYRSLKASGALDGPTPSSPALTIDTAASSPAQSAETILRALGWSEDRKGA
ncbi:MAG: AAA family ATPase [Caulobacter sp.]|nr:AAA family ATPase [Caulobacter sp.]